MTDKTLFYQVYQEVKDGRRDSALWLKAMTETGGDRDKAIWKYVELRVQEIESSTPVPNDMVPIRDFAQFKAIDESKVVNMVKDGFYNGLLVEDQWYVQKEGLAGVGIGGEGSSPSTRTRFLGALLVLFGIVGFIVTASMEINTTGGHTGAFDMGILSQQHNFVVISSVILLSGVLTLLANVANRKSI